MATYRRSLSRIALGLALALALAACAAKDPNAPNVRDATSDWDGYGARPDGK
jgi:hypothetical protein